MGTISGLAYPNSPISRSPRRPTKHFPCSSGQTSYVLRHKSPTNRHVSPHRSVSKNKIGHNWKNVKSIRKTQSTALTAHNDGLWSRGTTASTPDLKVEDQPVGTEPAQTGSYDGRGNQRTTCYYNLRLVFVILNCLILVASLIHLAAAVLMTIYKTNVSIIVNYRVYVLCTALLYTEAGILLLLSISELCFVHLAGFGKRHIGYFLLTAILMIFLGIFQNTVLSNIQNNLKQRMTSSIRSKPNAGIDAAWDYVHDMLKCCGARGHLDWCEKHNIPENIATSKDFLGSYTCQLPVSCCSKDTDKSMYDGKSRYPGRDATPCAIFPTPWNTLRVGCLSYVRREINYFGKLFTIMNFSTVIVLLLLTAITTLFFVDL